MYLFEVKVSDISNMGEREVASSSMIGDLKGLQDKRSVLEIMEKLGNMVVEYNSEKKGKVE